MIFSKKLVLAVALIFSAPLLRAQTDSATSFFYRAQAQAHQEHKHILMVFSASWCGPCKLYERFLEDEKIKPLHDKAFVVVRIDVGEKAGDTKHQNTPGGEQLRATLGAVGEPGFPFLVITDESGQPIVNSYAQGKTDANVGYPAAPEEIDWYVEMLKRGAPSLTPAELKTIHNWLKKYSPL